MKYVYAFLLFVGTVLAQTSYIQTTSTCTPQSCKGAKFVVSESSLTATMHYKIDVVGFDNQNVVGTVNWNGTAYEFSGTFTFVQQVGPYTLDYELLGQFDGNTLAEYFSHTCTNGTCTLNNFGGLVIIN
jgi:hypothetical protein